MSRAREAVSSLDPTLSAVAPTRPRPPGSGGASHPAEGSTAWRVRRAGAAIGLLAALSWAPSSLLAKESRGTVQGFVYDATTGSPLPQVQVEMTGEVKVAATTTAAGRFTIESVPAGTYAISYVSARHQPVRVRGLEVVAGAVADANTGMSRRDPPARTSSTLVRATSPAESVAHFPGGHGGDPEEGLEAGSSRVAGVIARVTGVTAWTKANSASKFGFQLRRSALDSEAAEAGASVALATGIEPRVHKPLPNPPADDHQGVQQAVDSAIASRGSVRVSRNGLRLESRDGAFTSEMHLRSQIRFSSPFASVPRQEKHFHRAGENDMRFRRARFKTSGHIFRPWIRYATEYDLVGTRMLDSRITVQKWEWLKIRFGQWKTEFGRERVSSSGRQEFVERSIVNREFTADRQKGVMLMGRVAKGTRADSQYYAGVFTGNGRGYRSSSAGSLDNRDGAPMWVSRYQWNFLKEDPGFSQSDLEYHEAPVAAIAIAGLSNRSRFTRFSGSGGGSLDGFEVGIPGQFAVRQVAEDFVLKYRGLFIQHEYHWKKIRDRIQHRITRMSGAYVQGGYFPHHAAPWVPEALELGLRYAIVDQDHARQYDRITEWAAVANWFMEGHANKLTVDVGRFRLAQTNGFGQTAVQVRVQWDVSF